MFCRFDVRLGFPFYEIRVAARIRGVQLQPLPNNIPRVTYVNTDNWANPTYCSGNGDVHVGTPAHSKGIASFGNSLEVSHCQNGTTVSHDTIVDWNTPALNTTVDSILRIQMGHSGVPYVGWRLYGGYFFVRNGPPQIQTTTSTTSSSTTTTTTTTSTPTTTTTTSPSTSTTSASSFTSYTTDSDETFSSSVESTSISCT